MDRPIEAELLVVIEHRVHVLDPDCVHWTIEQYPVTVRRCVLGSEPKGSGGSME